MNPSQWPSFRIIGTVQSCYREKFGTPRQSGLVPAAEGTLKFLDDPILKESLEGFHRFSHIWVIFLFHKLRPDEVGKRSTVRPPRLGGKKRMGVLATRSPHRPNPVGLSALKIEALDLLARGGPEIRVSGLDIVDQSPIHDVKPYLPYADSILTARADGWTEKSGEPNPWRVEFSGQAETTLKQEEDRFPQLKGLIVETLRLDPRPATQNTLSEKYAFRLLDFDVHWESLAEQSLFRVTEIKIDTACDSKAT